MLPLCLAQPWWRLWTSDKMSTMTYPVFLARQATHSLWKKARRAVLRHSMRRSAPEKRIAAERRWRGREDYRKLQRADYVIVSFGKSGRTWLRMMISRVYQLHYGLGERHLIGFDNLHHRNQHIPRIWFTHDNYLGDYTGHRDSKEDYYGKRVILLVRDPRDVAVSQFFQWKHRMKPVKKRLNDYPPHDSAIGLYEFVMEHDAGLPKVTRFLNRWAAESARIAALRVVRYEDFKSAPDETLRGVMRFLGSEGTEAEIREAIEFASLANMKAMEQRNVFWLSGGRMRPRDRSDPNSYKVRRGKAGGYRDYLDEQQRAAVDAYVRDNLHPMFGYTGAPPRSAPASQPMPQPQAAASGE